MDTLKSVAEARKQGLKIGFTCSTFDLLHAGHIVMITEAQEQCDFLVVGLLSDPTLDRPETKSSPVQSLFERWVQLQAVVGVGMIIPFSRERDIVDLLLILKPDVRVVGEEYQGTDFTGKELPVKVHFNKREHSFSSTELRERVCGV